MFIEWSFLFEEKMMLHYQARYLDVFDESTNFEICDVIMYMTEH